MHNYTRQRCRVVCVAIMAFVLGLTACGGGSNDSQAPNTALSEPTATVSSLSGDKVTAKYASDLKLTLDCYIVPSDFTASAGEFQATANCGEFVGRTNAAGGAYSVGQFQYNADVTPMSSIQARIQKTSGNISRPTEIYFRGGAVGWAFSDGIGYYYLYESEQHWTGWIRSDLLNVATDNEVRTVQVGKTVRVYFNGSAVDEFELQTEPTSGKVSVFFKGDPGTVDVMRFSDFVVLDQTAASDNLQDVDTSVNGTLATAVLSGNQPIPLALDFGSANDSSGALIRRITATNMGATPVAPPRIVPNSGEAFAAVDMPDALSCASLSQLSAGGSCRFYLAPDEPSISPSSASSPKVFALAAKTTQAGIVVSGSKYVPVAIKFTPVPAKPNPKIGYISPAVLLTGRRTLITIVGTNLPSAIALRIAGTTCENSNKPQANQVYCTASSSLGIKAEVLSAPTGTVLGALAIRVIPAKYVDPLDASYLSRVQREFNKEYKPSGFHTGWDIMTAGSNPSVRSLAAGTVEYYTIDAAKYKTAHDKYWNAFIAVKHKGFCAYYGHLDGSANLKPGSTVAAGAVLGKVRDGYPSVLDTSYNHLHISISAGSSCHSGKMGYRATSFDVTSNFVSPQDYIFVQ